MMLSYRKGTLHPFFIVTSKIFSHILAGVNILRLTCTGLFKNLKKQVVVNVLNGAEVAQFGRALDSTAAVVEGEAEDRVVAGSSPALGTTLLILE